MDQNTDKPEGFYDLTGEIKEAKNTKVKDEIKKNVSKVKKKKQENLGKEALSFFLDVSLNVVIVVALVLVIRNFFISPFRVYGPSMCDTLNYLVTEEGEDAHCVRGNGEYLIVNKFGYLNLFGYEVGKPERGDIIVFIPPGQTDYYIKRIIGMPGEKVSIKVEKSNSEVYIYNDDNPDGFKLAEPYLNESNAGRTFSINGKDYEFKIPEGKYVVFGDNRKESSDSRHCFNNNGCNGGLVPYLDRDLIEGKAWVVLWPFSKIRIL